MLVVAPVLLGLIAGTPCRKGQAMYTTTLADPVRLQQVALLCGTVRPFQQYVVVADRGGKEWAGCNLWFALDCTV